jgi:Mce-associated membrane protein
MAGDDDRATRTVTDVSASDVTSSRSGRPADPSEQTTDAETDTVGSDGVVEAGHDHVDPPEGDTRVRGRAWRRWLAPAVTAVVVVALGACAATFLILHLRHNGAEAKRQQFIDTARQAVVNLTTLHAATADADIQRLADVAGGDFAKQIIGEKQQAVDLAKKNQVAADGKVTGAGLADESGDDGTVLVAAISTVKNVDLDQPQQRVIRFRVTVHDDGGTYKATKLEMVP